jgi:Ca2+-binding EF-hand superfamily protein
MSITSTGAASGAGNLSQLLASMLSRIKSTQADASTTTAPSTTDSPSTDTTNAQTVTDTSTLSDQVIGVLVMMQAQGSDPSQSQGTSSSGSDPVSQAFSSLDTDGDGSISQSELETAITNAGGTAGEADTVYSALGGTSDSGISQASFASAAQAGAPNGPPPGGPPPGGHHHHHHSGSASSSASSIFNALDTNQDGSVSADELSSALGTTSTSGSSSSSSDIFSAADSNGDGAISQSEMSTYLDNLQKQASGDQNVLSAFQQLANQSYTSSLSLMGASATTQATTA